MQPIQNEPKSFSEVFNPVNNAFIYICPAPDGTYWVRSVSGRWVNIKEKIMNFQELITDFRLFMKQGEAVTENDVKADNNSQIIVPPRKEELVAYDPEADHT